MHQVHAWSLTSGRHLLFGHLRALLLVSIPMVTDGRLQLRREDLRSAAVIRGLIGA